VMVGDTDELDPNTFRQSLQIDYFRRLIGISGLKEASPAPTMAQSEAIALLIGHQKRLDRLDASPHVLHLRLLVQRALDSE